MKSLKTPLILSLALQMIALPFAQASGYTRAQVASKPGLEQAVAGSNEQLAASEKDGWEYYLDSAKSKPVGAVGLTQAISNHKEYYAVSPKTEFSGNATRIGLHVEMEKISDEAISYTVSAYDSDFTIADPVSRTFTWQLDPSKKEANILNFKRATASMSREIGSRLQASNGVLSGVFARVMNVLIPSAHAANNGPLGGILAVGSFVAVFASIPFLVAGLGGEVTVASNRGDRIVGLTTLVAGLAMTYASYRLLSE